MTKSNKIYIGIIAIVALLALVGIGYVGLEYGDKLRDGDTEDVRSSRCDNSDRVIIEQSYTALTDGSTGDVRALVENITSEETHKSDPYCHYILMLSYGKLNDIVQARLSYDAYQATKTNVSDDELAIEFSFLPPSQADEYVSFIESQQNNFEANNPYKSGPIDDRQKNGERE